MSSTAPQQSAGRQGVVAVIERGEKYLVIRRSQQVIAPGKLCFPGGGLEPGETEQQALKREVAEELGIAITPLAKLWESVSSRQIRIHWWSAEFEPPTALKPNPEEVAGIYWMTRDELLSSEELLEGNRAFLEQPHIARPARSGRGWPIV